MYSFLVMFLSATIALEFLSLGERPLYPKNFFE